jgi:hypothetical protein
LQEGSGFRVQLQLDVEDNLMSLNRDDEVKSIRKDPAVRRETLDELNEATDRPEVGSAETRYRKVNRDQARGDCDRSQRLDE